MRATSTTSTAGTATRRTQPIGTSTELSEGRRGRRPSALPALDSDAAVHDAASTALAREGVRYTTRRRTLVAALRDAGQPLTIPQLVEAASSVPPSSVYRNLAIFEEAGIVHRMSGPDDFGRYELAEELMGHHHHLVCQACGTVEDVVLPGPMENELDRVLRRVARQRGYSLASHRLELVGRCSGCDNKRG